MEEIKTTHHDLQPISASFHRWWDIFSRHFLKWMAFSLLSFFSTYLITIFLAGTFIYDIKSSPSWSEIFNWSSPTAYLSLVGIILTILINLICTLAFQVGLTNMEKFTLKKAFRDSLKYFWSYVFLGILLSAITFIILMACYLVILLLTILFGLFDQAAVAQWFDLFQIIPLFISLIASAYFIFAPYLLLDRNYSASQAVTNSFKLVRGHFWPTALRLLIIYALALILTILLSFLSTVGYILTILLTYPAITIYTYVLYQDLRDLNKA